jgi:hypothetical protein
MACPHQNGSLMRLPGIEYDDSARAMRAKLLAEGLKVDALFASGVWKRPRTKAARFENQVQSYALESIVIELYWTYLKTQPSRKMMAIGKQNLDAASKPYEERILTFSQACSALITMLQNRFVDLTKSRNADGTRSREDEAMLCLFTVVRHRHQHLKCLPFPSMKDLVTLLARVAGVVPKVFERDMGRTPRREEIIALVRHPSILRFFVEIMSNDRKSVEPLLALFEGQKKSNLNDLTRVFVPEHFEIHECGGSRTLRVKPLVIEKHRMRHLKIEKRRKKRGNAPPKVLSCPALYAGLFREMFGWTADLLEDWI